MDETYPLALALFDFVPNLAFLTGAYFLVKLVRRERGSRCARMLMAGTALIFLGGTLKAVWKLLYTLQLADVQLLSTQQFVLSGVGFLAMLVAIILLARGLRTRGKPRMPGMLALAPWKIPFLAVMTISSLGAGGILAYIAFRRRAWLSGVLFAVFVISLLGMAGMSSGTQTVARQWLEEAVNSIGQISFAVAAYGLYRTGC